MIGFEFLNNNPKGKKTTDCVVRAIALATGDSWARVLDQLCSEAKRTGWFITEKRCEDLVLLAHGFTKMKQPRKPDGKKYLIRELDQLCDCSGPVIVRCAGHLACVVGGKVRDLWDCRGKAISNYYVLEKVAITQ